MDAVLAVADIENKDVNFELIKMLTKVTIYEYLFIMTQITQSFLNGWFKSVFSLYIYSLYYQNITHGIFVFMTLEQAFFGKN